MRKASIFISSISQHPGFGFPGFGFGFPMMISRLKVLPAFEGREKVEETRPRRDVSLAGASGTMC